MLEQLPDDVPFEDTVQIYVQEKIGRGPKNIQGGQGVSQEIEERMSRRLGP